MNEPNQDLNRTETKELIELEMQTGVELADGQRVGGLGIGCVLCAVCSVCVLCAICAVCYMCVCTYKRYVL